MQSHQKDQCPLQFGKGIQALCQDGCAICRRMPCHHMKAASKPAVCHRNPCRRRHSDCRTDTGNCLTGNACRLQCKHFLSPSAKHKGIAALQPHHQPALPCLCNQKGIDFLLRKGMSAVSLADKNPLARRLGFLQKLCGCKVIIQHRIAFLQQPQSLPCNQLRIAAACPDQINRSAHFFNLPTTSAAKAKCSAIGALPSA